MLDFDSIIEEASEAAYVAGKEWLAKAEARGPAFSVHESDLFGNVGPAIDTMLDVCGFAWLEFPDKRSAFYRHCKKRVNEANFVNGRRKETTIYRVPVEYRYDMLRGRQEMGLKEAAMMAAKEVYNQYGIAVRFRSRID